jgi:Questin oxidase-like
MTAPSLLDEVLVRLHRHAPEYGGGMTDHAPMVVEALCAMGREDAVPVWLAGYEPRLDPAPADGTPPPDWRDARGQGNRYADLVALFSREIDAAGARETLSAWAPRLAPGMIAGAAHGLIRTGHAARAVAAADTAPRRRELAQALAYWVACWEGLPGGDAPPRAARLAMPSVALPALPRMPRELREGAFFFTESIARLSRFPAFAPTIDAVDASGDPDAFLSDLSRAAARALLTSAGRGGLVALVHAVTMTAAAREITAIADPAVRPELLRHAWHGVAAFYVALAAAAPATDAEVDAKARQAGGVGFDALLTRAIAHGDEHAIKLVEACAREHAVHPDPAYLAAALEGIERFETPPQA